MSFSYLYEASDRKHGLVMDMREWVGTVWRWDLGFNNIEESSVFGSKYVELMELLFEACSRIGCSDIIIWPFGSPNSFSINSCCNKLL